MQNDKEKLRKGDARRRLWSPCPQGCPRLLWHFYRDGTSCCPGSDCAGCFPSGVLPQNQRTNPKSWLKDRVKQMIHLIKLTVKGQLEREKTSLISCCVSRALVMMSQLPASQSQGPIQLSTTLAYRATVCPSLRHCVYAGPPSPWVSSTQDIQHCLGFYYWESDIKDKKGLISAYSSQVTFHLRAIRAGTQAGKEPGGRSLSRSYGGALSLLSYTIESHLPGVAPQWIETSHINHESRIYPKGLSTGQSNEGIISTKFPSFQTTLACIRLT